MFGALSEPKTSDRGFASVISNAYGSCTLYVYVFEHTTKSSATQGLVDSGGRHSPASYSRRSPAASFMEKKRNHSLCAPLIGTGAASDVANWHSIEEAIEQLYRLYYQPVLRHLERLVRQRQSAEDLCQEAFLKAFKHWDQLRDTMCVRGWLFQIATNTAVDYLRRQHRTSVTTLDDERMCTMIAPAQAQWEDAEPVWEALQQVPAHYRLPLVLQTIGGYTLDEIAAGPGCIPATIKTRVHRARRHFRQYYTA